MMNEADILKAQADQLQRYCWYALLALLAWLAVEALMQAPEGTSAAALLIGWLLHSLGLLVFLPGIRAGRARSAVWLAFVLLFYVISSVLSAFAPGLPGLLAQVETVLIIGLFVLTIRYVKIRRATQGGAL